MDLSQLPQGYPLDAWWKDAGFPFLKEETGLLTGEGTDHRVWTN
jgi:hypothetical protein